MIFGVISRNRTDKDGDQIMLTAAHYSQFTQTLMLFVRPFHDSFSIIQIHKYKPVCSDETTVSNLSRPTLHAFVDAVLRVCAAECVEAAHPRNAREGDDKV